MWVTQIAGNNAKVSITSRTNYKKSDEEGLQKKLEQDGILNEVLAVDQYKLAKQFKDNEIEFSDYEDVVDMSVSTYIGRVTEIKDKEE